MTTTLGDYGRASEKHGEIAFYYAFPFRFYFGEHQIAPEDVNSWCTENALGYYKVGCYTHKDSIRVKSASGAETREFEKKIVYVDKIYLSDPRDAALIKERFSVKAEKVQRPRLKQIRRRKADKNVQTVAE
jgi:hypothetical protein